MRYIALAILMGVFLATPSVTASDPFSEQSCVDETNCFGPGTCIPDLGCIPRHCQPLLFCRGEASSSSECQINMTIEGQTCQLLLGMGARSNANNDAWIGVALTDGNVDAFNLPNTWITPSIEARLRSGDIDTGDLSVGVYQSHIVGEGPRGGPLGLVSPSPDHDWNHVAVIVHHGTGSTSGDDIIVGVYLLDLVPEGCYARTSASPIFDCPRIPEILP